MEIGMSDDIRKLDRLSGQIYRVTFTNHENGYTIDRVSVK